jgi:S-formylglutathione hydrolase FrmB
MPESETGSQTRQPMEPERRAVADVTGARDYKRIWIGCGSEDFFFGGAKACTERLQAVNIPHVFCTVDGAHVMPVFRQELAELLPFCQKLKNKFG